MATKCYVYGQRISIQLNKTNETMDRSIEDLNC